MWECLQSAQEKRREKAMKEGCLLDAGPILALSVLTMMLAGCGGGSDASAAGSSMTPWREFARIEVRGKLSNQERRASWGESDVNNNGVRDDIERYIEKTHVRPAQRRAAMQTALALQKTLEVDTDDAFAMESVSRDGMRAVNCRGAVFLGVEGLKEAFRMSQELEVLTTNTPQRLKAYRAYNDAVSGTVSQLPAGDTCD